MALKIRLRQQGRHNRPFYRLVVTDVRNPRDGKYLEMLGWYNPFEEQESESCFVKPDRLQHWLDQGAEATESVLILLKKAAPHVLQRVLEKEKNKQVKLTAKRRQSRKRGAKALKA